MKNNITTFLVIFVLTIIGIAGLLVWRGYLANITPPSCSDIEKQTCPSVNFGIKYCCVKNGMDYTLTCRKTAPATLVYSCNDATPTITTTTLYQTTTTNPQQTTTQRVTTTVDFGKRCVNDFDCIKYGKSYRCIRGFCVIPSLATTTTIRPTTTTTIYYSTTTTISTCYDSDGGSNPNIAGYVIYNSVYKDDYCSGSYAVQEYSCLYNPVNFMISYVSCPNGCEYITYAGRNVARCKAASVTTTTTYLTTTTHLTTTTTPTTTHLTTTTTYDNWCFDNGLGYCSEQYNGVFTTHWQTKCKGSYNSYPTVGDWYCNNNRCQERCVYAAGRQIYTNYGDQHMNVCSMYDYSGAYETFLGVVANSYCIEGY